MAPRRPGSPSVGRGGSLAARRALILLAALPMCIAFYRLCSGGSSAATARSGGLSTGRRLGGDVLEVPHPLEQRVQVAATLAADSAAEHSADTSLERQEAEPGRAADAYPAQQQEHQQQQQPAATVPQTSAVAGGTAAVHGFVHKAGPLDPKLWQPQYRQWRRERRQAWLDERQQRLDAGGSKCRALLQKNCKLPSLPACHSRGVESNCAAACLDLLQASPRHRCRSHKSVRWVPAVPLLQYIPCCC